MGWTVLAVVLVLNMGGCQGVLDEEANRAFRASLGGTSVTVFATYVRDEPGRYDPEAARAAADLFESRGLARVAISDAEVPIAGEWHSNQAKMFAESTQAFAAYLAAHPVDTDYAALAEYLIGGRGVPVGVHFYLLDGAGKCAYAVLSNSHHTEFQAVDPQTVADATEVLLRRLRQDLGDLGKSSAAQQQGVALGPKAALTILPFSMGGKPWKDVADVVGLMLEQEGMPNVRTVEANFRPTADADLEALAAELGAHVREAAYDADCVLWAEFLGKPGKVEAVRGVLVGRDGEVLWTDEQKPGDAVFERVGPENPMTCCLLLKECVAPRFRLTAATRAAAKPGRMAKLWQEKSGTPEKGEQQAIEARQVVLRERGKAATVAVYPVQLLEAADAEAGAALAALLAEQGVLAARVAAQRPRFDIAPNTNEQRRLWDLAKAARAYVTAHPPEAEYALVAEYTIRPDNNEVWSVHTIVCDRAGELVVVDYQNNHHGDFQRINPQSLADCHRLVVERLSRYLR
jgi:hypothetical protein